VHRALETINFLFGSKLGLGRILDSLYGAFGGVHAFDYNFTESEPIWVKSEAL